jgi:hypothetical protein
LEKVRLQEEADKAELERIRLDEDIRLEQEEALR